MSKEMINRNDFSFVLSTIKKAQNNVYKQVNKALPELYREVGKYVSGKVAGEQWGKSVIEELSYFIRQNEPNIKGFTTRNI